MQIIVSFHYSEKGQFQNLLELTHKPGLSTKFCGLNNNITGQNPVSWLPVRKSCLLLIHWYSNPKQVLIFDRSGLFQLKLCHRFLFLGVFFSPLSPHFPPSPHSPSNAPFKVCLSSRGLVDKSYSCLGLKTKPLQFFS